MRFVLIILAVLICGSVNAQDIIVRITGDTLHVKVDSQNDTFVYYISPDSKRGEREVISRKEIAQILYNFEKPDGQLKRKANYKTRDYQVIQFYAQFTGYYLPDENIPKGNFKEYYEELQFGTGYKAGGNYFLSKQFGVGLTYSLSKFSNSIPVRDTLSGARGRLSDDVSINYFGASAEFRFDLGESETNFMLSVGAGMNLYHNDAKRIYGYILKAHSVGFHATASLNLSLGGGLYIPITFGYIGNTVGNISLEYADNMPDQLRESLQLSLNDVNSLSVGRLFAGLGLSFAF